MEEKTGGRGRSRSRPPGATDKQPSASGKLPGQGRARGVRVDDASKGITLDNVPVGRGRASATASLRPPSQVDPEVVEDALLKKLTMSDPDRDFPMTTAQTEAELAEFYPPQTKLSGKFPGKIGKKCSLQTNHFPISLKLPQGVIYQYDVVISPPWASKRGYKRADKALYHLVIKEWKRLHPVASKSPYAWVFDGHKQLFCTKMFKQEEMTDLSVEVWCEKEEKMLTVHVKDIQISGCINVNRDLVDWSEKGRSGAMPQDAIQALNIVLKESINLDPHIFNIGRSYFHMEGTTLDLGFGKEVWAGNFSCIRPMGWKEHDVLITLNVDTAHKAANKNLHLTNESAPGKADSYVHSFLMGDGRNKVVVDLTKGLSEIQVKKLQHDMKDMKVKYVLEVDGKTKMKRSYKVNGFKKPPNEEIIADLGITVQQYFKNQYKIDLKYPAIPTLWVGPKQKTIYVPMELCSMEKQPMPMKKKLPDDAIAKMIRSTAVKPEDRQKRIIDGLKKNNSMYKTDPYAKEFGITVAGEMTRLTGRILFPPDLEYSNNKSVTIKKDVPGKWFQDKNHYVKAQACTNWCMVDLANLSDAQFNDFRKGLATVARANGMTISDKATDILRIQASQRQAEEYSSAIEEKLIQAKKYFEDQGKKLELVFFVFANKAGFLYDKIKQLCDMKFGIITQCAIRKNLFKQDDINLPTLNNICLKINSKLGGVNHILSARCNPAVLKRPVMVMGCDVSHPAPEARGLKPSIAAIVGSVDPKAARYEVEVRVQDRTHNEEMIHDMKQVTKNLLLKFHAANKGRKPEKIIMYRDGVSEGQFLTVLAKELTAMRQACTELEEGYKPAITYIVVQKRHHTRFFPADNNKYRNGNALAGTVVDQGINHPTEGDFYLLSHEGIQGTSRPCHYQVLWDDSSFSADELEVLSYYLCHLYSRCTRAVSYPTPTYYAHLVADRARKHHNELVSNREGSVSGSGSGGYDLPESQKNEIKKLVEEGVKNSMYFV